jgi:dihydrofolate reductase
MDEIPKIVFSRSLKTAAWGEARIVAGDLAEEIKRLKREPGRDLLAHGGVRFAQSLIASGLIDEYRLVVHPVVLGSGKPLFPGVAEPTRFKLLNQAAFRTGLIAVELRRTQVAGQVLPQGEDAAPARLA